jgi:hypothetical protein
MQKKCLVFFSVIFFVFGVSCSSYSQSKKEQIQVLQVRADSLADLLEITRYQFDKKEVEFDLKITSLFEKEARLNEELSSKSKALQELAAENKEINSKLGALDDSLMRVNTRADFLINQCSSLKSERDRLQTDLNKQLQITALANPEECLCENWIKDNELELDVRLSEIAVGDMSTYLTFETKNNSQISFSDWTWNCKSPEIGFFSDSDIGSYYRIKVKNTFIKELEYKGFEIGNVETGSLIREWVLLQITRKSH